MGLKNIKARVWDKENQVMVYSDDCEYCFVILSDGRIQAYKHNDDDAMMELNHGEAQFFTGLHDATTWDELTEGEKKAFYEQHKSEDGERIKYRNIEDVRHLWKGKEVFEGDIVSLETYSDNEPINDYSGEILIGIYGVGILGVDATGKEDCYYYGDIRGYINKWEVIGNIYQNPELIGGRD